MTEYIYAKKGTTYYGCSGYPDCNFISWEIPLEEKCPICGDNLVKKFPAKGGTQIVCNNKNNILEYNNS